VDDLERRLADYYDLEGERRLTQPLDNRRVTARQQFVELLRAEERTHLLEVGSGPGRDAVAFADAGLHVIAIDRSPGHARLAAGLGLRVIQASALALPLRPTSFDAGWTMSTLVHVPDAGWDAAMASLITALRPGAPVAIGLWGGVDHEGWLPPREGMPSRFFSLRSHDRARTMLAGHGVIESFSTWPDDRSTWHYQFALLRVGTSVNTG
jgi:SAM-dependent methyltransferase